MPTITDSIIHTLEPLASPAKAAPMAAYMKGHFDFLGLTAPERRAAVTPLIRDAKGMSADDLIDTARELWLLPRREYQYAALD
jgi:3-methyladenine DNA glycosylase AlkD